MAQWAVNISADRWATERLFQHDTVTVPVTGEVPGATGSCPAAPDDEVLPDEVLPDEVLPVAEGDEVLLVAEGAVVALARVVESDGDDLVLAYARRAFDEPVPAAELSGADLVTPVDPATFRRLVGRLGAPAAPVTVGPSWLVSVALPIEAATPAEAVRRFWSHVLELGPAELPAYVSPAGDELAMQAFVLGEQANQDPEEED